MENFTESTKEETAEEIPFQEIPAEENKETPPEEKTEPPKEETKSEDASSDFLKDYVQTETSSSENTSKSQSEPKTEETKSSSSSKSSTDNNYDEEDFEVYADVAMDTLDWIISSICVAIAKDNSTVGYELPQKKKDKLVRNLSKILKKYQKKFPFEAMFLLGLIAAYSIPIRKAYLRRKAWNAGTREDVKDVNHEDVTEKPAPETKRKGGRPKGSKNKPKEEDEVKPAEPMNNGQTSGAPPMKLNGNIEDVEVEEVVEENNEGGGRSGKPI